MGFYRIKEKKTFIFNEVLKILNIKISLSLITLKQRKSFFFPFKNLNDNNFNIYSKYRFCSS